MEHDPSGHHALANIFSSKLVGVLFAAAFGAWAFVLNSVSDRVIETQEATRDEVILLKTQIAELRGSLVQVQINQAKDLTEIRERQNAVLKRLDNIEAHPGRR